MIVQTPAQRFSSLTAMKAAHLDLIKQYPPGRAVSVADLDHIEAFVLNGRATGVVLDSHDQQRDAQCLLDHWAGFLAKHRRDIDSTLEEYDPAQAPDLEGVECPYPGLEAFQTSHALHFFGRTALIDALVRRCDTERFLAIVGPSGSGKSSLILAGLVPALTHTRQWGRSLRMVPGEDPVAGLAHAVGPLPGDGAGWFERRVERLRQDPEALPALLDATGTSTILVVDQFEETFTICGDASTRLAFEATLVALIRGSRLPHRVLVSMRSDYEGHLTRLERLWPEFVKAKIALLPLGPSELREAIVEPARQVGLKFEDGLVDALYSDVVGEAAALPLLQAILKQLWQRKHRNLVTWDQYKRLGNGRTALGRMADEFYSGLIPEEQMRVKRVFVRLVRPAAGQEVTSSRISRRNLSMSLQNAGWLDDTLERLQTAGLIRVTNGDTRADDEIEVAHEALVRNWPTLVEWQNQERSTMTLGRRLESRIAEWLRLGAGTAGLLDEESLAEVKRWRENPDAALVGFSDKLDQFIAASQAAIDRARQEQEGARQREVDLQKSIALEKTLKARQWRRAVVAVAVLCLIVLGMAWAAFESEQERAALATEVAKRQTAEAEQQTAAAQKRANSSAAIADAEKMAAKAAEDGKRRAEELNSKLADQVRLFNSGKLAARAQATLADAETSLLLAWASARVIYPSEGEEMWEAAAAIRDSLREARAITTVSTPGHGKILDSIFTPDGLKVVTASADGSILLWDAEHGVEAKPSARLPWTPKAIAVSPDGARISVGGPKEVVLLDTNSLHVQCRITEGPASRLTFTPDSKSLASLVGGDIILSDVETCKPKPPHMPLGSPDYIAFSGNGYWLAARDDSGTLRVWDTTKRKGILSIQAPAGTGEDNPLACRADGRECDPLAFKPDGTQLAVALERSINIYSTLPRSSSVAQTGLPTGTSFLLAAFSDDVTALAYDQRGELLAAGSRGGTVTVWNAGDRRELFTFASGQGVTSVAFSPDSRRMLTTMDDGSARIWSTAGNSALLNVGSGTYHLAMSQDRSRLGVYGGSDNIVRVVDPQNGNEVRIWQSSRPLLLALDGVSGRIASATDQNVILYDASGQEVHRWPLSRQERPLALAVSPGGRSIAVSSLNGLWIWTASGMQSALRDATGVQSLAFSPDGSRLVGTADRAVMSWDVASGERMRVVQTARRVSSPLFSADSQRISAQVEPDQIRIWTAGLEEAGTFVASRTGSSTAFSSLRFSPDWKHVVTVNAAEGVNLWDAAGRVVTNLLHAKVGPTEAVFLKDGRIAVLTKDGLLYVLPVHPADTMRAAMSALGRAWNQSECEERMPVESSSCATTVPAIQTLAAGNRVARAGDIEKARGLYVSAIELDPWLRMFISPPTQAAQQAARSATQAKQFRASSLMAQGESLIRLAVLAQAENDAPRADGIRDAAVQYFAQAGETDAKMRAQRLKGTTAKEQSQVLLNTGRFLAGRMDDDDDDDANQIAIAYLEKAKRLDPFLEIDPRREVAQRRIELARAKIRTNPSSTLRIYLDVQKDSPELTNGNLWNQLCWRGSLYASAADQREWAEKAAEVSRACDEAVKANPMNANYADSRGLNLLLLGKGEDARKDFQMFIASKGADEKHRKLRIRWVEALAAHPDQNPLTGEEVAQLRAWDNIID